MHDCLQIYSIMRQYRLVAKNMAMLIKDIDILLFFKFPKESMTHFRILQHDTAISGNYDYWKLKE